MGHHCVRIALLLYTTKAGDARSRKHVQMGQFQSLYLSSMAVMGVGELGCRYPWLEQLLGLKQFQC